MGLETPTVGASRGTWGGTVNSNFTKLDGHNHTSGSGVQVPTAGININADLSFNSLYGPKDLHALTFASIVASTVTNRKSLFVSDGTGGLTSGELYWLNGAGNNVKLTDGNSLNVSAFVGGIGGDYTAVSAAEAFDNASKNYTFNDGSAHWAGLHAGSLVLSEKGTSSAFAITIDAPAGLAATYALKLPAALPGSTLLAQVSNAGVVSFSNTVVSAATFSGLITASAGLTAAANQHVTVSGTGRFKHGTLTRQVSGYGFIALFGGATADYGRSGGQEVSNTGSAGAWGLSLAFDQGVRIQTIRIYVYDNATGPTKVQAGVNQQVASTLATTSLGTSSVSAGTGAFQTLTISGINTTVTSGTLYYINILTTTGTAKCQILGAEIDYDRP
jgi:hypothetical protein